MKKTFRGVATAIAVLCCLAPAGGNAFAQSAAASAAAARDPEYQALFKRMFANPQDMEATFKFAEVAARLGDYEAAIGALERVLFYNPNLAQVKVELGQLYLRIGGVETARSYFQQAIETPGVTPEVKAAAEQLMTAGDTAGFGTGFTAFVYAGMRYQTNASAGPTGTIRSFGDDAVLDSQFAKAPDWNSFILSNLGYAHDFGSGIAGEINLFNYYAKQVQLSQFDLGLVELQAGPRIAVPSSLVSDASVKLYGIGTASWLAEDPYYNGAGVGISSRFTVNEALRLEPFYEYRDRNFYNSDTYPTSAQQSGVLHVASLIGDGTILGTLWIGRLSASWNRTDNSRFDFNSYDRLSADIAFPIPFKLNWWGERQFVFTPTAGFSFANYLEPNPTIDRAVTREDREWRIGAALDMQVYESWGIRTIVQYADTASNLPNFEMNNLSISVGPTYRF